MQSLIGSKLFQHSDRSVTSLVLPCRMTNAIPRTQLRAPIPEQLPKPGEHRGEVKAGKVLFVSSGCSESPVVPQLVTPALVCPSSGTCPAPVVMNKRGWSSAGDSSFPEMIPSTHQLFGASQICIHIYKSHLRLSSEMRFVFPDPFDSLL